MRLLILRQAPLLRSLAPCLILFALLGYWQAAQQPLAGQIIVVDPGHGGIDPGANRPGILEKDVNLAVALRLREILSGYGAQVVLTRESDRDLGDVCENPRVTGRYRRDLAARIECARKAPATLFISIHANAGSKNQRGCAIFYPPRSESGKQLAESIRAEMVRVTVTAITAQPGNYFVLRRAPAPAVLIETGYITNPEDRVLLQQPDHQQRLAAAIGAGVARYCRPAALSLFER